ncbi:MAG: hypothetical protein AABY88_12990 [Pseudomonadota bacterium]
MTKAAKCKPAADYRTDAPRIDGWTPQRQAAFLMTLAQTGLVSRACDVAGMSTSAAYALRREPRGRAFHLGWQAAHLIARDRLEDVLLEAAISGVESVTTRVETTTHRRALNGGLSMRVLNRLDLRLAAIDDVGLAAARSVASAFEAFIGLVLNDGVLEDSNAEAIAAFLEAHPDPLGSQNARVAAPVHSMPVPQLVEKSAISARGSVSTLPVTGWAVGMVAVKLGNAPEMALRKAA